jgi:hypothetical protein
MMTFDIEIVLRESDRAIARRIVHSGNDAAAWTELDVQDVLKAMLRAIHQAKHPASGDGFVALRGFSWIVEPASGGVVIALEIPTGAAVAGPFDIAQPRLDALIKRALAPVAPDPPVVH